MNLTYVFSHGDPVLVSTFLLLVGMSLTSWYVIIWKGLKFSRERQLVDSFEAANMQRADWPKYPLSQPAEGSVALLLAEVERVAPVVANYDEHTGKDVFEMHLSQSLDSIRVWLDKGLTILASVGSSAPFVGLFGTVWGIYNALTNIATEGNADLAVVAGPMGEALVATAIGLFAAIPAVLAYNGYVRLNRLLVQDLRHIAEQLALYRSNQGRSGNGVPVVKLAKGA